MFSVRNLKAQIGTALVPLLGLVLLVLAGPGTTSADDRDLLRATTGKPYVMILLDTSGSMNWTPPCTQAQFNAGECQTLCPFRDCFARLQSDDASSKFYQAKQALYEVLKDVNDVQFGFSTYNQDDLQVKSKHWIYKAGTGGISIPGSPNRIYPVAGSEEVFGTTFTCDNGSADSEVGCTAANPADLDDNWELTRLRRLAKGGTLFTTAVVGFIRWGGVTYEVTYTPVLVPVTPLGATTIVVNIDIDKCTNTSCSSQSNFDSKNITYTLGVTNGFEDQFISWENGNINRVSTSGTPTLVYYNNNDDVTSDGNTTCNGWDPNTDTSSDDHSNYNLRYPTATPQDSRGAAFTSGDVIPFDWLTDHKADILKRLAPNQILNPAADPDFRIAPYLKDIPVGGFLQLKNEAVRPLIDSGSTPLGASLNSVRTWYQTWKTTAAAQDPDWGCRRKYVLLITDGDETCSGSPCTVTSSLRTAEGVLTYVVAFGLQSVSGNTLSCMATNGGTGAPIYPQNKDELVAALTQIFGQIREQASSFASAAVPTVQTEVADKIYISNFTPLNGESIWNGHIDSYLKPLPLNAAGLPDRSINCPATGTPSNPRSGCHLWDAATQMLNQAPSASDLASVTNLDAGALHLGLGGQSQRRVFYGKADPGTGAVPRAMRIFAPPPGAPATDADWLDLFTGFKLTPTPTTATERNAAAVDVKDIMKQTLVIKSSTIQNGTATPIPVNYVLGDTFHADPTMIDRPNDFDRYAAQLYKNALACADDATGRPQNPSYKCWADKHKRRRKMLAIAANDGQLHFFDAGIYRPSLTPPAFDDGGGYELFSYMPRLALPIVRSQAQARNHIYALDSTPRVQEVFIDSAHTGTPTTADRQWRTVLIGGFREGGKPLGTTRLADFTSGYYALDITQPDTLDASGNPSQGLTPSCLTLENTAATPPTGCGPVPFPALLWEFTDSLLTSRLDEDADTFADLGQTWSVPTVGRIQIKNASNLVEDRYVAIFGGGMDAERKSAPKSGTWVYILDIETGKLLYKQKITGAVPADPAVVDTNSDGVLDTIYMGTTSGFLYKIDMRTPVQLQSVTLTTNKGIPAFTSSQTVQRITDTSWLPKAIFDTGGKPIYYPPVALFVPKLESDALVFGTGDREDLWNMNAQEGRFYVIVDDGLTTAQNESSYVQITPTGASTATDLLINPPVGKKKGWYMRLPANERVITKAFGLSGLIVFSSYEPQLTNSTAPTGPVCGRTGTSRVYTLYANNGNPVLRDPDTNLDTRFQQSDVFVAPPTVDIGGTKNDATTNNTVAKLTAEQVDIMTRLKAYFPASCKFGNYWYTVSAMGSDTRFVAIAAVPICFIEHNWKEVQ